MQISYSILFDIQLLHEYFSDRKSRDIAIVPAEDCIRFFKGAHILWRNQGNKHFALIRENSLHEPFINIVPDDGSPSIKQYRQFFGTAVFRFYLQAQSHVFFNYTNIGPPVGKQVYYFSNLANNKSNGIFYLSKPVGDHATGKEYLPGDLVGQPGTENVFEAIRKHTSTNVAELSNASLWSPKGLRHLTTPLKNITVGKLYAAGDVVLQPATSNVFESVRRHTAVNVAELADTSLWTARGEGQLQYPAEGDLIEFSTGNYLFALTTPATTLNVSFFSFNYNDAAPAYNVLAGTLEPQTFSVAQTEVNVNLSILNPGKYMVQVNGESRMVYYDPLLAPGNVLGIIEIFNHLPGTNEYALLAADESIVGMSYALQFSTRRVLWKYIRKDSRAQTITDTGTTGYTFPLHADEFVSATPIPLSEEVLETLELTFSTADFKLHPLPNPSVQRLGRFMQNGYDYLCSEMFLNY